jgi:two-component system response regulator BaeR
MKTVLIVEDEPKLAALEADYLKADGFGTHVIADGLAVVPWVRANRPDLVLLDLMLPGRDGLDICRDLRTATEMQIRDVPIVIVTAKVEEIDRLIGLDLGADDYVCKPFSARELVARVKAILRRPRQEIAAALVFHEDHSVKFDGRQIQLTPVEFRLLRALAAAPGRVLSRDKLLAGLYDDHRVVTGRTVDTHVKNLRRKLGEARPDAELVRSIYGVGYKLEL